MHWAAIILVASKKAALRWLISIGGPGLILLGLADNRHPSAGSTDLATVLLAAHHSEMWFYYAFMATADPFSAAILPTTWLAGGQKTLERFSQKRVATVYAIFERFGFAAVVIPASASPPSPCVPMLLAAALLQYPTRKNFCRPRLGRAIRFTIMAYLERTTAAHHTFLARYTGPCFSFSSASIVLGGLYGLFKYKRGQHASGSPSPDLESQATRRAT